MKNYINFITFLLFLCPSLSPNTLSAQKSYMVEYTEVWACDSNNKPTEKLIEFTNVYFLILDTANRNIEITLSSSSYKILSIDFDHSLNSIVYNVDNEFGNSTYLISEEKKVILHLYRTKEGKSQITKLRFDQVFKRL